MRFRALGTLTAADYGRRITLTTEDTQTYSGTLRSVASTNTNGQRRVRFELRNGQFTITGNYLPADLEVQVR